MHEVLVTVRGSDYLTLKSDTSNTQVMRPQQVQLLARAAIERLPALPIKAEDYGYTTLLYLDKEEYAKVHLLAKERKLTVEECMEQLISEEIKRGL